MRRLSRPRRYFDIFIIFNECHRRRRRPCRPETAAHQPEPQGIRPPNRSRQRGRPGSGAQGSATLATRWLLGFPSLPKSSTSSRSDKVLTLGAVQRGVAVGRSGKLGGERPRSTRCRCDFPFVLALLGSVLLRPGRIDGNDPVFVLFLDELFLLLFGHGGSLADLSSSKGTVRAGWGIIESPLSGFKELEGYPRSEVGGRTRLPRRG